MAKKIDPNKIIGLIFGDYIIIDYLGTFHNSIKVLSIEGNIKIIK